MFKSSRKIECAESLLIPTSSPIFRTVKLRAAITRFSTLATTASFRAVCGLLERCSLSNDVQPFFNQLDHSLICITPIALSPNACWILRIVSLRESPSFWQNLMHYLYSIRSIILRENPTNTCHTTLLNGQHPATDIELTQLLNSCMRIRLSPYTVHSDTNLGYQPFEENNGQIPFRQASCL